MAEGGIAEVSIQRNQELTVPEQNLKAFGETQVVIRSAIFSTTPEKIASMGMQDINALSQQAKEALIKAGHSSRSLSEAVIPQRINEHVAKEKRLDEWWRTEGKKLYTRSDEDTQEANNEARAIRNEAKRKLLSALTAKMENPPEISEEMINKVTVERMHGGTAIHVPLELFAAIAKPKVEWDDKGADETDESAFLRIAKPIQAHLTVERLHEKSEIDYAAAGLPQDMEIAFGYGDFVPHVQEDIYNRTIATDPLVVRVSEKREHEGIAIEGSTDRNIITAFGEIASRLRDGKKDITPADIGITQADMDRYPDAVKMLLTALDLSEDILKVHPEMRTQLILDINSGLIAPDVTILSWYKLLTDDIDNDLIPEDVTIKSWYKQLPPEQPISAKAIIAQVAAPTDEAFQMVSGATFTFERAGRSISELEETLQAGDRLTVSDGTVKIEKKIATAGQAIIYDATLYKTDGRILNDVVKEPFFDDRDARIDVFRSEANAQAYWDDLINTRQPLSHPPQDFEIESLLFDMRDFLRTLSGGKASVIYSEFGKALDAEAKARKISSPLENGSYGQVMLSKFGKPIYDDQTRVILAQVLEASLKNLARDVENDLAASNQPGQEKEAKTEIGKLAQEVDQIRQSYRDGLMTLQRITSPYLPRADFIVEGPSSFPQDIYKENYRSLYYGEEKVPGEQLFELTKTKAEQDKLFPSDESFLDFMNQGFLAVMAYQKVPAQGSQPALRVVHGDLHDKNIMLRVKPGSPGDPGVGSFESLSIIDLGLIKIVQSQQSQKTQNMGKDGYAAPEQYSTTAHRDLYTDVYGLGECFIRAFINRDPDILQHKGNLDAFDKATASMDPKYQLPLHKLIEKMTELKPEDRYEDASEAYKDFLRIYTEALKSRPFPKNGSFQEKITYLDGHQDDYRPASSGSISLSELETNSTYANMLRTLQGIEKTIRDTDPAILSSSEIGAAFDHLEEFVGRVEGWCTTWGNQELAQTVRLEAARRMRNIIEYTAPVFTVSVRQGGFQRNRRISLWDSTRIDRLSALVGRFASAHPDAGSQTQEFRDMFENVVGANEGLRPEILIKLKDITRNSAGWGNTHFRNEPDKIVEIATHILEKKTGAVTTVTRNELQGALDVVGALPDADPPNPTDKQKATDLFFDTVEQFIGPPEFKVDEVIAVMDHLAMTSTWDNEFLKKLNSNRALEVINEVIIRSPVAKPEWIVLMARLSGVRMERTNQLDAAKRFEQILRTDMYPKMQNTANIDNTLDALKQVGQDPSLRTFQFRDWWSAKEMSYYLGQVPETERGTGRLLQVLDVAVGVKDPTGVDPFAIDAARSVTDLLRALPPGHEEQTLLALDHAIPSATIDNQAMFSEELAAVAQKCIDVLMASAYPNPRPGKADFHIYARLILKIDPATDVQSNHFIDVLSQARHKGWLEGISLVPDMYAIATGANDNKWLKPPNHLYLTEKMQNIILESAVEISPKDFDAQWLEMQINLIEDITNPAESERLAKRFHLMMLHIAESKNTDCRVAVIQQLTRIKNQTNPPWKSKGLQVLQGMDLLGDAENIFTTRVRSEESFILGKPPSQQEFEDTFDQLKKLTTEVKSNFDPVFIHKMQIDVVKSMSKMIIYIAEPANAVSIAPPANASKWYDDRIGELEAVVAELDTKRPGTDVETEAYIKLFGTIVEKDPTRTKDMLEALSLATVDSDTWTNKDFQKFHITVVETAQAMLEKDASQVNDDVMKAALQIVGSLPDGSDRAAATDLFLSKLGQFAIAKSKENEVMHMLKFLADTATLNNPYLKQLESSKALEQIEVIVNQPGVIFEPDWIGTTVRLGGAGLKNEASVRDPAFIKVESVLQTILGSLDNTHITAVLDGLGDIGMLPEYQTDKFNPTYGIEMMSTYMEDKIDHVTAVRLEKILGRAVTVKDIPAQPDQAKAVAQRTRELLTRVENENKVQYFGDILDALNSTVTGAIPNDAIFHEDLLTLAENCMYRVIVEPSLHNNVFPRLNACATLIEQTGNASADQTEQFMDLLITTRRENLVNGNSLMSIITPFANTSHPKNRYLDPKSPLLARGTQEVIEASVAFSDFQAPMLTEARKQIEHVPDPVESGQLAQDFWTMMTRIGRAEASCRTPVFDQLQAIMNNPWLSAPGLRDLRTQPDQLVEDALSIVNAAVVHGDPASNGYKGWLEITGNILGDRLNNTPVHHQPVHLFYEVMENVIDKEPDLTEKAEKIQAVMEVVTDINAKTSLPNTFLKNGPDQVKVLATVVDEMIDVASSLQPADMTQWSEKLLALSDIDFSSLDDTTRTKTLHAIRGFLEYLYRDPTKNAELLSICKKASICAEQELRNCISNEQARKLFLGVQTSVINKITPPAPVNIWQQQPSPTVPDSEEIALYGIGLADELSHATVDPADLRRRTYQAVLDFKKIEKLGATSPSATQAVINAYIALLQSSGENENLQRRDAIMRLDIVSDLTQSALTSVGTHHVRISDSTLAILNENMSEVVLNPNYSRSKCAETVRNYINLLRGILRQDKTRKSELRNLAGSFSSRISDTLYSLDSSLDSEFEDFYTKLQTP